MSVPTSSTSTAATPESVIYQAPINLSLPTYDWNAPDQMHEFRLFKCQLDTSTAATPESVIYQAPINLSLPTYDWNAPDQMHEFRLFKCQLDTWFWLHKIKAVECLDYLLCILGKEGYAAMGCWVPTDEAHK